MKRRTTTAQINEALTNSLFTIEKAEVYYKSSHKTDDIESDKFLEDFQFLCEANVFMDSVGWNYQKDYKSNQYIIETGRMDGDSENIVTVFLRVNEGVSDDEITNALLMIEED